MSDLIVPDWPAPASVRACSTTRAGGVSAAPWDSLNLGDHVGDRPEDVLANRHRLKEMAALPAMPHWRTGTRHRCGASGRAADGDASRGRGLEQSAAPYAQS